MMRQLKAGLLVIGGLLLSAVPAMALPDLSGSWKFTFYLEPNHTTGATQCLVFTPTGRILSEAKSGTWTSPTFSGWKGQWIQEGDRVRIVGFTSGGLATSENNGLLISANSMSGEFDHFFSSTGYSSSGAWYATKVSSCTGQSATMASPTGDPSGK
jgi:hypothetical protein